LNRDERFLVNATGMQSNACSCTEQLSRTLNTFRSECVRA
jgi:hypothetical protein